MILKEKTHNNNLIKSLGKEINFQQEYNPPAREFACFSYRQGNEMPGARSPFFDHTSLKLNYSMYNSKCFFLIQTFHDLKYLIIIAIFNFDLNPQD